MGPGPHELPPRDGDSGVMGIIESIQGHTLECGPRSRHPMSTFASWPFWLAVLFAALLQTAAAGDSGSAMRDAGEYSIYYNAVPAAELDAWVAQDYGLPQGEKRCVVTVAVVEKETGAALEARIMAHATRPDGRMYQLDMRPISDAGGLYYIGELPLETAGMLEFTLRVEPHGGLPPQTVQFQREFPAP